MLHGPAASSARSTKNPEPPEALVPCEVHDMTTWSPPPTDATRKLVGADNCVGGLEVEGDCGATGDCPMHPATTTAMASTTFERADMRPPLKAIRGIILGLHSI